MAGKTVINLATGLEDSERVTVAFLVGTAALDAGKQTAMFLTKEAVRLALPGTAEAVACEGCPPLSRLFQQYTNSGGELLVCPICFNARKLDESQLVAKRQARRRHTPLGVDRRRARNRLQLLSSRQKTETKRLPSGFYTSRSYATLGGGSDGGRPQGTRSSRLRDHGRRGPDELDELIAPGFIDHDPEPDQAPGAEGVKEVFRRMRSGFPDMKLTPEAIYADGDTVIARVRVTGTHNGEYFGVPPTGKSIDVTGVDIVRLEEGKAVERWGVFDGLKLMQQLGQVPAGE